MKKIKILSLILLVTLLAGCSDDKLSSESVIKDPQTETNKFDDWILENMVKVYNIDLKYRMEDIESDMDYNLVPANYNNSIVLTQMVKFLCLEAYDTVTGDTKFIRKTFPKIIHLIGSPAYRNNGTMVVGTAEGGRKITLYNVNGMIPNNVEYMNQFYFHTIHHEFSHILHQTKPYSPAFKEISADKYVTDSWKDTSDADALKQGFISPYASSAVDEDFVELIAFYITLPAKDWDQRLVTAGKTGRPIIENKFDIIKNYLADEWEIDIDLLRDEVAKRIADLKNHDFTELN